MTVILVLQAGASVALAGLIWFVQRVHYPMFASAGPDRFPAYELEHAHRTTLVVAPLMVTEAATAAVLLVLEPGAATLVGALLVVALWSSTVFLQVPCHRALRSRWDAAAHRRLVRTNWLRTLLWSGRGALALALLAA
jgi:hypothetical protein